MSSPSFDNDEQHDEQQQQQQTWSRASANTAFDSTLFFQPLFAHSFGCTAAGRDVPRNSKCSRSQAKATSIELIYASRLRRTVITYLPRRDGNVELPATQYPPLFPSSRTLVVFIKIINIIVSSWEIFVEQVLKCICINT